MTRSFPKFGLGATSVSLPLVVLLGAGLPVFAQLTLTSDGVAKGFTLSSFVKGFTPNGSIGPMGIAVAGTGNVIVHNYGDQTNYVLADSDGQDVSLHPPVRPFSSTSFTAFPPGFTFAFGSVWGSQGYDSAKTALPLVKINDDGTVPATNIFNNLKVVSNGMWTNPVNGHIIGVSTTALYDIDVSTGTPIARPVVPAGVSCAVPGSPPVQANPGGDGVTVSPDGKIAYIADNTNITGFLIATGACVFGPVNVPGGPDGLAAILSSNTSLNGQIIVNTNAGQVYLMDPQSGVLTLIADHGTRGDYVAPDNNNRSLFVTQSTEVLRLQCSGCRFGNPPLVLTGACPAAPAGSLYSLPLQASGGNGTYSLSFPGPSWLNFSAGIGAAAPGSYFNSSLTGFAPGIGTYPVTVTVKDTAGSTPTSFSCTINITPAPLVNMSTCPTSPLAVGTPFSEFLTANGGVPPYSWTITGGGLPAGLSLVGSTITGSPSGPPGISNFNIVVTSTDNQTVPLSCSLTVTQPPALQITSGCPAGTGTRGVPYGPFTLTATGGNPSNYAFSFVNGSPPAGVTINGNILAGTPTAAGTSSFNIQVASAGQTSMTPLCTVAISLPLALNPLSCPTTVAALSTVSVPFLATGGQSPYLFTLSGQPSWLSIVNGAVSGTVPAEAVGTSASFTVTVTDAAKASSSQTCPAFPITAPPPTLIGQCPNPMQMAGTPLAVPVSVMGGQEPFNWTLDNGGDPDLALASPTGRTNSVTGTLTKQGSFTFTVGIAGLPLALTCPITVSAPALQITASPACPTSPVAFGTRFSTTLTAPGANGSYSWNVTPNPPFSSSPATGQSTTVSATLSTAGPTGFTATLSDSAGATAATYNCAFTVAPLVVPPITITPTPITTTLSPVPITLTFASPLPADLIGILTLTFTSKAFNPVDNPMVTFSTCGTANCGTSPIRTYQFTVPAGTTSFPLNVMVQVGRVFGTIQLQLTSLMLGNLSVLPSPAPSTSFDVPAQAPVISAVQIMNFTPTGFTVQVTGFSTPRDISDPVTLTFTAAPDATLQGAPLTISGVSSAISSFFGKNSDSMFTLNLPVSVSGDISAIASVTVSLKNSVGTAAPVTHSVP